MNATTTAPRTFTIATTVRLGPDHRREVVTIGLGLSDSLRVLSGDLTPLSEVIASTWARLDFEVTHGWFEDDVDLVFLSNERLLRSRQSWEDAQG